MKELSQKNGCYIHPNCIEQDKNEIRFRVCNELGADWDFAGNKYCFLHLPSSKSPSVFQNILKIRIARDDYDFRYVYFPTQIHFSRKELPATINFNRATFLDTVSFVNTRFLGEAKFIGTTFKKNASFNKSSFFEEAMFSTTVFESEVNFSDTDFLAKATFYRGTFHKGANFKSSRFKKLAHFDETTFKQNVDEKNLDFSGSRFENGCKFFRSKILCAADFSHSIIDDIRDPTKRNSTGTSDDKPGANFIDVEFGKVTFNNAAIKRRSDFSSARFNGDCKFEYATFEGWTEFTEAKFNMPTEIHSTSFKKCAFVSSVRFEKSEFYQKVSFDDVRFNSGLDPSTNFKSFANFVNCKFHGLTTFNKVVFLKVARFWDAKFYNNCYFTDATFKNTAQFKNAKFFKVADGKHGDLTVASFESASFEKSAFFTTAEFHSNANFSSVDSFDGSRLIFSGTTFYSQAQFKNARLNGHIVFTANKFSPNNVFSNEKGLDLDGTRIKNPKNLVFHSISLDPKWFTGIDSTEFDFINCKWPVLDRFSLSSIHTYLNSYKKEKTEDRRLAVLRISLWNLAENAQKNNRFSEASKLRRLAFETEKEGRRELYRSWKNDLGPLVKTQIKCISLFSEGRQLLKEILRNLWFHPFDFPHFIYRYVSGYGENWFRALFILLFLVVIFFPTTYYFLPFKTCGVDRPIGFSLAICDAKERFQDEACTCKQDNEFTSIEHIGHSLHQSVAAATLHEVEYRRPMSEGGEYALAAERILAPIQLALLALAIRRKFMR